MKTNRARSLLRDERGLSTVEYTVLLVLIMAVSVGIWNKFGKSVSDKLTTSHGKFEENVKL